MEAFALIEGFILNKSMLSEQEQNEILMSLQSLHAVKYTDVDPVLNKLSGLFNKQGINWVDVDFSHWGSDDREREKFNVIKTAILNANIVTFDYFSSAGEKTGRTVEPLKLIFKGRGWYLYGYCRAKDDFRVFKITRIKNLSRSKETFARNIPDVIRDSPEQSCSHTMVTLILKIDTKMAFRLYDEFDPECIKKDEDGNFIVTVTFPEDEWVYGYIMSYGSYAEVLEPKRVREIVKRKLEEGLRKYL